MRTPSETAALAAEKYRIAYVEPPADLVPKKGPDYDGAAWDKLHAWFEDNTSDANQAILCFFAEKAECSIGMAYIYTDGWGKRRANTDEDGVYWSYN
jgi:hypothetical protein